MAASLRCKAASALKPLLPPIKPSPPPLSRLRRLHQAAAKNGRQSENPAPAPEDISRHYLRREDVCVLLQEVAAICQEEEPVSGMQKKKLEPSANAPSGVMGTGD
ncbi:uncharacterized protein LOC143821345 [Paroedura picta]|uniref:uncharacterized protein LOC143821345 n=1 Tax=Paroedura picta TaxID=143630 RepID=UPI00405784B4